jgi:hypothetical protein
MNDPTLDSATLQNDTHDSEEYVYCRYRRCGKRLLDARAYGLKAWRFPVRRKKNGGAQ